MEKKTRHSLFYGTTSERASLYAPSKPCVPVWNGASLMTLNEEWAELFDKALPDYSALIHLLPSVGLCKGRIMLPFYPKPPVWKRRKSLGIAYNHPLRLNQK